MKNLKTLLLSFGLLLFIFGLTGCQKNQNVEIDVDENAENGVEIENSEDYEGELEVAGIASQISFGSLPTDKTLILDGYFEDHADHLNIAEGKREEWFKSESETLPGNKVKFQGKVKFLDGAAGNHYYEVVSIDNIENIGYTDSTGVKEILEGWNYCEADDDCAYIAGECPFGCYVPLYKDFADIAGKIMENYFDINGKSCVYNCLYMDKVVCENYKCAMATTENQ